MRSTGTCAPSGNTLMLPMRRLGLWSFCINRYGSLIRGSRSKIRALARPTSKVTNAEHSHSMEKIDFVLRRMDGIERQYVVNCLKALRHKPFTGWDYFDEQQFCNARRSLFMIFPCNCLYPGARIPAHANAPCENASPASNRSCTKRPPSLRRFFFVCVLSVTRPPRIRHVDHPGPIPA